MMGPALIFEFGKDNYVQFDDMPYGIYLADDDIYIYRIDDDGYSERLGKLYSLYTKSIIEEVHFIKNPEDSMNYPTFSKKCLDIETENGSFMSLRDRRLFNALLPYTRDSEEDSLDEIIMQMTQENMSCVV